jgi:threonine aldolase
MRQAGIIAAPGLAALDNVDRLADDHANAARLAEGLDAVDGLRAPAPDTNIVQVFTDEAGLSADEFVGVCEDAGVLGGAHGDYLTRFCTHLDVSADDVDAAIDRIESAMAER